MNAPTSKSEALFLPLLLILMGYYYCMRFIDFGIPPQCKCSSRSEFKTPNERKGLRRVYIDIGAKWGGTLRLYQTIERDLWGKMNDMANKRYNGKMLPWEVYAFESDPVMQGYTDNFVRYLNHERSAPSILVPPATSFSHLTHFAVNYGCWDQRPLEQELYFADDKEQNDTTNRNSNQHLNDEAYDVMSDNIDLTNIHKRLHRMIICMRKIFAEPLSKLRINDTLDSDSLVLSRLNIVEYPTTGDRNGDTRYTFIPAEAGTSSQKMPPHPVTPAHAGIAFRIHERFSLHNRSMVDLVRRIDISKWILQNFREEDLLVVKSQYFYLLVFTFQ